MRVVVVDNDGAVLDLLLLDLGLEGHDIVGTAECGEEAVRVCEELRPDVLVVDLRLGPGIDGLEVARRVAKPGLRVLIHTNYVNPTIVELADEAGAIVVEKGALRALRRAVCG